jgi:hypothetical protein
VSSDETWLRHRIAATADAAPTPGSHTLLALTSAASLRDTAAALAVQAALAARAAGIAWQELDGVLLGPGRPASGLLSDGEAAFYYCATGSPWPPAASHSEPLMVVWTCPVCLQRIADTGPWSGPAGEGGHTPGCGRHAADTAWYAQCWDGADDPADPDGGGGRGVAEVRAAGERL